MRLRTIVWYPIVFPNPGKKAWWKKSLVEKMAVERKPGLFWKRWKKAWCIFFLGLIHIKMNDEVKLTHYFIHLNTKCVWYI